MEMETLPTHSIPPATQTQRTTSSNQSPSSWSKLAQWLKGPDLMRLAFDPDKLDECRKYWDLKWEKYHAEFPEDSLKHLEGMGQTELRERSDWLQAEVNRIRANVPELSNNTNDPQILVGLKFVGELLDKCQADLVTVSKAARADFSQPTTELDVQKFEIPMEQLKMVERSHMFILSCTNKIVTLKQAQALRSRHQMSDVSRQSESEIHSLSGSRFSQDRVSEPEIHPDTAAGNENTAVDAPTTIVAFRSSDIGPGGGLRPPNNQTPQHALTVSSSGSHLKNLTALLGIAFFGASITWSTIFSGTRGDLVLISWSACLFIVGAVGAGSASMLVLPQDLITQNHTARWTVRVLSLLAMVHVLAGIFLLALAILVLDPSQENPQAAAGRAGMQSAGGYAIALSAIFVGVSGVVWRRHTPQTWFRSH